MSNLSENNRLNDLLRWEAENLFSREKITVLSGQKLLMGAVIGKVKSACPTTGTADGGNTGDGTCTGVAAGAQVKLGAYTLTCIAAAANAGDFEVRDPDDYTLGQATVGSAYASEQINFTLNDGSTDFAVGDKFTIAVTAGSGKMKKIDYAGVDGTEDPYGFITADCDASAADRPAVAVVRDAIIVKSALVWPVAFTGGGTSEIKAGDTITGATSAVTAVVQRVALSSGSWAGGDAAGVFEVNRLSGDFQAENVKLPGGTDDATVSATKTVDALAAMKAAGIIVRDDA